MSDFMRDWRVSRWDGEVMRASFEERCDSVGRMGGDVGVRGRPRRDSRCDRRDERADSCVVSEGE
jgi:hypothetical protein